MLKKILAITAGKLTALCLRMFKLGSGTSLPGKVALKLDPNLLRKLGRQVRQSRIAITGTNGKSTTAGLLSAYLETSGVQVVHNQLGANMVPGITAALLSKSNCWGKLTADYAVIEADEASLPAVNTDLNPELTVVTNLFRDQLDRYGELDTTAKLIRQGIETGGGMMALNADDPMVASIGQHFPPERVIFYGVQTVQYPSLLDLGFPVPFPKEVTDCPICQAPLHYTELLYGHLGHYNCVQCDFKRPTPWLEARTIEVSATQSKLALYKENEPFTTLTLDLPGLFNAYNVLAAATAGAWAGLDGPTLNTAVGAYHSIFGRAEKRQIEGKTAMIMLIKNPVGAMEVLKVVTADPNKRLVIMINDDYADGRDISWLWDAPFELLRHDSNPIMVSGHRAEDMAVRLKYAGVPESLIQVEADPMRALHKALQQTPQDHTLYVLPTYTALLNLSQALGSR